MTTKMVLATDISKTKQVWYLTMPSSLTWFMMLYLKERSCRAKSQGFSWNPLTSLLILNEDVDLIVTDGEIEMTSISSVMVEIREYQGLNVGSRWKHKNGNIYTILAFTNIFSEKLDEYPVMVVYQGENGKVWSREYTRWHGSMTLLEDVKRKTNSEKPANLFIRLLDKVTGKQSREDKKPLCKLYKPQSPLQDALRFRYLLYLISRDKNKLRQILWKDDDKMYVREQIDDYLDEMSAKHHDEFMDLVNDIDGSYTILHIPGGKKEEYYNEEAMLSILLHNGYMFANNTTYTTDRDDEDSTDDTTCLFINCNDYFHYATSDAESITTDELPELFKMYMKEPKWGVDKWCSKKRNLQPISPVVEHMKKDGVWDDMMESLRKNTC